MIFVIQDIIFLIGDDDPKTHTHTTDHLRYLILSIDMISSVWVDPHRTQTHTHTRVHSHIT